MLQCGNLSYVPAKATALMATLHALQGPITRYHNAPKSKTAGA